MHGGDEDGDGDGDAGEGRQWQQQEEEEEIQEVGSPHLLKAPPPIVGAQFALPFPLLLSVLKKKSSSSLYNLGDFCFRDPEGRVLFLTSARHEHSRNKRVLLNPAGIPILSAHRKMLSFYNRWDAFRGESIHDSDALFSVKRSAYFQIKTSLHVFVPPFKENKPSFKVKGSYHVRECLVLHGTQLIAEIKRGAVDGNVSLTEDQFIVTVQPGVDHAFIAGLIIIMDEIHREQNPSTEL